MEKIISFKINDKSYSSPVGPTILDFAKANNLFIPNLCHHPDLSIKANCRVCLVEVKGVNKLLTACSTKIKDGQEIYLDSPRVKASRTTNIELLFAEHIEKCPTCTYRYDCGLLDLARRYKIKITTFPERKTKRVTYKFANAVELDGSQCIDCRNCVEACAKQGINYLEVVGQGISQEIKPTKNKANPCILCGQCALHCPVNAAAEQTDLAKVEKVLKDKSRIVVAEFAPSVRAAIGEEFNAPYSEKTTGQTISALKKLGFKHVFDVNYGADITTMVEAGELIERLKNSKAKMPMITSCCPSWVVYVENYHPELIPNLTSSRSPQIHIGGVIKTRWASLKKIDPKKITVVSVMPCTSKKFEAARKELKINGLAPVDLVITTREFAFLLKKNNIDLSKLKPEAGDQLLNESSGAAVIYGSSGGVMESALRTAYSLLCRDQNAKFCVDRLDFNEVRGLKEIKEAIVPIAGKKLRVAVVNGLGAFPKILPNLKKYDYIEVMACPGGCIGGGGQPIPTTVAIRAKRTAALYEIDKFKPIRKAHDNQEVLETLAWLKKNKLSKKVLETKYYNRKK